MSVVRAGGNVRKFLLKLTKSATLFYFCALIFASGCETVPQKSPDLPGESLTSARLAYDTAQLLLRQSYIHGEVSNTCKDRKIAKVEIVEPVTGAKMEGGKLIEGYWRERWTLDLCGYLASYRVTFIADGRGGTNISTKRGW